MDASWVLPSATSSTCHSVCSIMYCYSYFSTYFLSKVLGYPNYYLIMFDLGIRLPFRNLSSLREKISNAELISSLAQHTFNGFFL